MRSIRHVVCAIILGGGLGIVGVVGQRDQASGPATDVLQPQSQVQTRITEGNPWPPCPKEGCFVGTPAAAARSVAIAEGNPWPPCPKEGCFVEKEGAVLPTGRSC